MSEVVKPAFELKKVGETLRAVTSSNRAGSPTQSTTCFAINKDGTILALGASDLTTVSILYVRGILPTEDKDRFSFTETEPERSRVVRPDTRTYISHEYVRSIAFHPTEQFLVTLGKHETVSGNVKLWQIRLVGDNVDMTPVDSFNGDINSTPINSVAFHPTEMRLAICLNNNTTQVWSFYTDKNPELFATLTPGMSIDHVVNVVAFHPTEPFLATGCDNTSMLWKLDASEPQSSPVFKILDSTDAIKTLAFHPSGKLLATGDAGHNLKLWDFNNYDRDDRISCVNTLSKGQPHYGHNGSVVSVAFHPTGDFLATGSWDRSAKVWTCSPNGRDVKLVATIAYNTNVNSVAFYPVQKGRVPILAIGRTGGLFETYELTRPSSGVSDGGTRRRTPRRHRRRTQTRTRRRSRKQQQRSRRRRHRR
jgi:WD40 repeat protein